MSVLIIGIGNKYRSDDAVGLEIADSLALEQQNCFVIRKSAGEGVALINLWEDYDEVILIDAVFSGSKPGTIHHIDSIEDKLESKWFQASSHLLALPEAIKLAKALGKLPEQMMIYGIEGQNYEYGVGLSPEVQKAKTILIEKLKNMMLTSGNVTSGNNYA